MSDQPASGNNNNRPPGPNNNNNNRNNNRRRPQGNSQGQNANREAGPQRPANPNQQGPRPHNPNQGPRPNNNPNQNQGQAQSAQGGGSGQRRRPNRNNRSRNPNAPSQNHANQNGPHGINIERIYEKYLNLLDQHLIARRKYHDLFYRADPGQKNKLERNFYNTLNDIRDFESKLAPEARELFEKRNNGLRPDNIYTSNHELPTIGDIAPPETETADPHFLQSQKAANYAEDKEESVGTADDYLKYKNLL